MGLSSLFRKRPQESESAEGAFYSRAEEDSKAVRNRGKRKAATPAAEAVDPVLPEKKRARRRLVGAVALVLAAVIGLPMVLDSEPKPLADDISIQIPSRDLPPARPVTPRAATANVPQGAALDKAEEVIDPAPSPSLSASGKSQDVAAIARLADDSTPKVHIADATPVKSVATPESQPNPKPVPLVEHKPELKPESKAEKKPEPKAEAKSLPKPEPKPVVTEDKLADSARARAILDGDAGPAKADKKPTRVIVQIAALASKEKVAELQEKLKSAGISSYTQTVSTDSGARIRIRIGPFSSQEDADKARAKLAKIGLTGTVVPS